MSSTSPKNNESFASLFEQSAPQKRGQTRYQVGDRLDVTIVVVGRDALFAELGGKQEGVFERIDLTDPDGKLHVDVGSRVSAIVASIDRATGQIKLKPTVIRNPDADILATTGKAGDAAPLLIEGARIKGKVTGVERYGVFVQIAGTSGRSGRGLIPTAETATPRGSDLKKHFILGQDLEAKILNIDDTGKIRLSISALAADAERADFEAFKKTGEATAEGEGEAKTAKKPAARPNKPTPRNFGTLGDLLSKVTPKAAPKAEAKPAPKAAPKHSPAKRKA